jgi:hypothetical protein
MKIEETILDRYNQILDAIPTGKGKLKFGRNTIRISDIAQQYYCEKALELKYEHPLPRTQRMIDGESGHESITSKAEPISREESVKEALVKREKPICIYEFGIAWKHKDIPILGLVDEAWFREGNVELVLERKFSNSLKVYSPYHIQAQLYCLGLGEMGFNNLETQYRIMVHKRQCYDCPELVSGSCEGLSQSIYKCDRGECMSFSYPFNKRGISSDLEWAMDFWFGKREAIPTKVQAKCKYCQHKGFCEFSLI